MGHKSLTSSILRSLKTIFLLLFISCSDSNSKISEQQVMIIHLDSVIFNKNNNYPTNSSVDIFLSINNDKQKRKLPNYSSCNMVVEKDTTLLFYSDNLKNKSNDIYMYGFSCEYLSQENDYLCSIIQITRVLKTQNEYANFLSIINNKNTIFFYDLSKNKKQIEKSVIINKTTDFIYKEIIRNVIY